MNRKNLLSLYGLKWNPFSAELPDEALVILPLAEHFLWRIEMLAQNGGFAMIYGDSGLGKSVTLRLVEKRLLHIRDLTVAEFSRPQSGVSDFYRELGNAFGLELNIRNRWGGFKALRELWKSHIEATFTRPVLLIDEAQEMPTAVLSELRLLSSMHFDSKLILAVVLSGDTRLPDRFRSKDLIPLGNRIRLHLEPYGKEELRSLLLESLARAGAPQLMTDGLLETLVEHAMGNPRIINTMAHEVLMLGAKNEAAKLDEKLFLEAFPVKKRA